MKDVVYVERQVTLSIPLKDIQSVTIVRKPFAQSMEDAIRQMQGMAPQRGPHTGRAAFDTTLVLTSKAALRITGLTNAHDKGLLDVRLNAHRLGVARVIGPFAGNSFRLYLAETDRSEVERLFKPIAKRVLWKDDD